jgi:hypothetical protein
MEVVKYSPGDELTYKTSNQRVKVIHNTLNAGGVNAAEATVWIETKQGTPVAIPVSNQDRYLTTEPPKKGLLARWPMPKQ